MWRLAAGSASVDGEGVSGVAAVTARALRVDGKLVAILTNALPDETSGREDPIL